jgi:hypothetical protein
MSLTRKVADLVAQLGEADADQLAPLLPDYTRAQVAQALHNARSSDLIEAVRHRARGPYQRQGRPMAIYAPKAKAPPPPPRRRVASVWELGR